MLVGYGIAAKCTSVSWPVRRSSGPIACRAVPYQDPTELLTAGLFREVQVAGQQSGDGAAILFDEAGEAVAELPPRGPVGPAREVPKALAEPNQGLQRKR